MEKDMSSQESHPQFDNAGTPAPGFEPQDSESAGHDENGVAEQFPDADDAPAENEEGDQSSDLVVEDGEEIPASQAIPVGKVAGVPKKGRQTVKEPVARIIYNVQERMLLLDTWKRSKLPAGDFASLVGMSPTTLYEWDKKFRKNGLAGLTDQPKGAPKGSKMPEAMRRAALMMKEQHPGWGSERIHDNLLRIDGFYASPGAIQKVLEEEGYVVVENLSEPHGQEPKSFERASPNQMWQTDIFTFTLKRENRRVHLVAYMDDHSRFITGYGLHATASSEMVQEALEAGIANYGAPEEVLTDNGTQYHNWRGKSRFTKRLEKLGIKHIVASPRHPQTLGKVERFWGSLWNECAETAVFQGIEDARKRIGLFIDHYNFMRTHQGIGGLVPADRYFAAAPDVLKSLRARVEENSADLALHGVPRKSMYLTGRIGDKSVALHTEGDKVILTGEDGTKEEIDLKASGRRAQPGDEAQLPASLSPHAAPADHPGTLDDSKVLPPGTSPLDPFLKQRRDQEGGAA